jgi:hypothetical protein
MLVARAVRKAMTRTSYEDPLPRYERSRAPDLYAPLIDLALDWIGSE